MRGQAALQGLYNPDRIKRPLMKEKDRWRQLTYPEAEALLKRKAEEASGKGRRRVRLVTEVVGKTLMRLFNEALEKWKSGAPLVFEPYAYESQKTANRETFGLEGLASYRMEEADMLLSLGADFLETWLSPVAYARKFKEMHALRDGKKPLFFHVSPYQSLTAANADLWIPCRPGGEAALALGLIRDALSHGRGKGLPQKIRKALEGAALAYRGERVVELAGISPEAYGKVKTHLLRSKKPLILGVGTGGSGLNTPQANTAANL